MPTVRFVRAMLSAEEARQLTRTKEVVFAEKLANMLDGIEDAISRQAQSGYMTYTTQNAGYASQEMIDAIVKTLQESGYKVTNGDSLSKYRIAGEVNYQLVISWE